MRLAILLLLCCCAYAQASPPAMYRCEVQGVATYSDRPCGADATMHETSQSMSTFTPPPVTAVPKGSKQKSPRSSRAPEPIDKEMVKRAELCERLSRSQKEVRSKMRAGYRAKEGERLRDRLAKLKSQAEAAKCK